MFIGITLYVNINHDIIILLGVYMRPLKCKHLIFKKPRPTSHQV